MSNNRVVAVVVPVYNEEAVLSEFHARLSRVMQDLPYHYYILYVNDGSHDQTLVLLESLQACDPRVALLDLSRNFGKEIAMSAGLDYVEADAVILIDADLQDPPELIPSLLHHWHAGFDVVYGTRIRRQGESWLKRTSAYCFYRLLHCLAKPRIPADTGDFRLLSQRAVQALRRCREPHRFMKGLFNWIGYPQKSVPYERPPRAGGHSKWGYFKLIHLAIEGVTSFSIAPLRLVTYLGYGVLLMAGYYTLRGNHDVTLGLLWLNGLQLLGLGILGAYVGRAYHALKQRPLYFINRFIPAVTHVLREQPA